MLPESSVARPAAGVPTGTDQCAIVVVGAQAAMAGRAGDSGLSWTGPVGDLAEIVAKVERDSRPRWVTFSAAAVLPALLACDVRLARCHDIAEVHRLLAGGWRADPHVAWAHVHGLAEDGLPRPPTGDLFEPEPEVGDPDEPTLASGYLRPDAFIEWAVDSPDRIGRLADLALELAGRQVGLLREVSERAVRLAWSESAGAVMCAELEHDGLPLDVPVALELIATAAGPRPVDAADAGRIRRERDLRVLRHQPGRENTDLRNPAQVLQLLTSAGVVVDNTRKWAMEPFRDTHPVVADLLDWRRDERIATTYGYQWLDSAVGPDGRLRGGWTACDGGGGRMTAQNGLHNLPALLRPAIAAEPGHVFVRADLGQIEPRVLAAVSGDPAFAEATRADDLYAPVAAKLGSDRATAKVAVLAAMYGQRSGAAGRALGDLERAYPVAMAYLDSAYRDGVAGRSVRTFGGRLIRAGLPPELADTGPVAEPTDPVVPESPGAAGGRGRYLRNAVIQGAAAELFKAWAATVRHVVAGLDGRIVLCLHDELLVHVPDQHAEACAALVEQALTDSARRWAQSDRVRFVADTSVIRRWSEAKA